MSNQKINKENHFFNPSLDTIKPTLPSSLPAFTCSRTTMETKEQCVKPVVKS